MISAFWRSQAIAICGLTSLILYQGSGNLFRCELYCWITNGVATVLIMMKIEYFASTKFNIVYLISWFGPITDGAGFCVSE